MPYNFTYTTTAKGRWIGKKLLEILKLEFYQITDDYYVSEGILQYTEL